MSIRRILFLASATVLALPAVAQADGWRFAPLLSDPAFKLEPTLALTAGHLNPTRSGADSANAFGIEANFNCGLIQSPDNRIRTHLGISRADEDGDQVTVFELSPRYTVPLGGGLSVGAGPSLSLIRAESDDRRENLFGYGAAGGVNYRQGAFYAGADLRYQASTEKDDLDFDHWAVTAKVGVNF